MSDTHDQSGDVPVAPIPPGTVADTFREALPDVTFDAVQGALDVILTIAREDVPRVLRAAKEDPRLDFKYLRCLSGVDHGEEGLEVVYQLYSYTRKHSVTVKARVPQEEPRVASVTSIWRGADWHEREAAEMFGIQFEGHPNLVPLLLPEDMTDHHPLRKDVPLVPIEEWQGVRLGPEVANVGNVPAGWEHLAGPAESGGEEGKE
jgi:NADH-quinone oxidoreductase subunit C